MDLDPFRQKSLDPFNGSKNLNPSAPKEIFVKSKSGGGGGGRKSPKPDESELEPLDIPLYTPPPAEPEEKKTKVFLRNPKWESEDVGFNEDTEISVEVDLPEDQAHKKRVHFELFAKTPNGPERISQADGSEEDGKAKCSISVYQPQYKMDDGTTPKKVEYYFTAKHSGSDLLDNGKSLKVIDHFANKLIKYHVLQDVTFGFDKSFLKPGESEILKQFCAKISTWKQDYPDGKLAVFGHADAVGKEGYNKTLSERRARAIHALIVKEPKTWLEIYDEEKWDLSTTQDLLKHLGYDPGTSDGIDGPDTQKAVKGFQSKQGLPIDGVAGKQTREKLYRAFMDECNSLEIKAGDFDTIDGKPFAGCSEFNRVEQTDGACEANRRVAVVLLKSNKNFPINYPCKFGDVAPCKRQVAKKGDRNTKSFGCQFYDQLVTEADESGVLTLSLGMPYSDDKPSQKKYVFECGDQTLTGDIPTDGKIKIKVPDGATAAVLKLDPDAEGGGVIWQLTLNAIPPVEDVKGMQIRLNNIGFFCGDEDGELGKLTQVALKTFQQRYGILADGQANDATKKKIKEVYGG